MNDTTANDRQTDSFESTNDGYPDPTDRDTTHTDESVVTDGEKPHPHWLVRAHCAHDRLSGGGD
jgi:hypothetical protein